MKELSFDKMEARQGGMNEFTTGVFCGVSLVFALFVFTAPLIGATGPECALGLYANYGDYPKNN
jgi:hypothetical protein